MKDTSRYNILKLKKPLQRATSKITKVEERNDSVVKLWTLDYENPGSNPVLQCYNGGQVLSLYVAPVHSAV